ncbi:MAG: DUF4167 domain-containing protein [Pseudomonadota bacterium]
MPHVNQIGQDRTQMAQYSKRGRNNNRRRQGGNNNPNRSMDSQGPEVKIRGTATQIYDKYQALARDAASSGDRIRAESLMQHAEHYYRLMKSMQPAEKPAEPKKDEASEEAENTAPAAKSEEPAAEAAPKKEAEGEASSDDAAAAEEQKPRRRRRRRRSDDEDTGDKASAPQPDAAPALEDAPAE